MTGLDPDEREITDQMTEGQERQFKHLCTIAAGLASNGDVTARFKNDLAYEISQMSQDIYTALFEAAVGS